MSQSRVCKYLRHPSEAFVVGGPMKARDENCLTRMDPNEIDLCIWFEQKNRGHDVPPVLTRKVGGGADLIDGDCDRCPCFEPVSVPPLKARA